VNARLADQIELVEALADFARFKVQADRAGELIVRLARRLVVDSTLPDSEVVRLAGRDAMSAVKEHVQ